MEHAKTTPKDFFLWAGAMVALYVGVFNYIALFWDYINYAFPNPLAYTYGSYIDPYQNGISWEMAILIVLTPTFLLLMWLLRRDIATDSSRADIWVRRWALFLTLFIAGATVVGDLIYVLYAFLNGSELTTQFLLKALVVLFVAAIGFMHFLADFWGYWKLYPTRNRYVAIATLMLVFLSVIAGFFIVGSPAHARMARFDNQKVNDLQTIQYQVLNYWQTKRALPASLDDLENPLSGFIVPIDPQATLPYEYKQVGVLSFELCATFNTDVAASSMTGPTPARPLGAKGDENWQHGEGRTCFTRTIDPTLYPPQPVILKTM